MIKTIFMSDSYPETSIFCF